MIQSDIDSINSWLASDRDYDQGIAILVKHSRNPSMKRIFQGREHRYATKLSYEIGKLISEVKTSKPLATKPVKHVKRYAKIRVPILKKRHRNMIPLSQTELQADPDPDLVDFVSGALTKSIGRITPGRQKHYYSDGNFNLLRLIFHILKQTGPAHIMMSTYSISQDSLEKVRNRLNQGEILSIRFLINNRVKVMSPSTRKCF